MDLRSTSKLLKPLNQLLAELCAELTLSFSLLYTVSSTQQPICRLFEGNFPRLVELTTHDLPDLVDFQCLVPVNLAYCGETRTTQVALQALLEQWGEEVKAAKVVAVGARPTDKVTSITTRDLKLYCRNLGLLQRTGKPVCLLSGMLDCRVSVTPDLSVADLYPLLKADLLKSLRVRLELLDPEQKLVRNTLSQAVLALPRRVVHRAQFNLLFCDYLSPEETFDTSRARLMELAGVTSLAVEHHEVRTELATVVNAPKASLWMALCAVLFAVGLALLAAYETNLLV
jgi:hypothetical protein